MSEQWTSKLAQIIKPPTHIRTKVGKVGGVELNDVLARAQNVYDTNTTNFLQESLKSLTTLEASLTAATASSNPMEYRDALFYAAHDIRGISGTFGYPLATMAADLLCKFILKRTVLVNADLGYIRLYIDAIGAIFRDRMINDGGAAGAELKTLLTKITLTG